MKLWITGIVTGVLFLVIAFSFMSYKSTDQSAVIRVRKCADFMITGDGSNAAWQSTDWIDLPQRSSDGPTLITQLKVLYSDSGMYFLFHNDDRKITSTMNADFMDLWKEDVVELFLWPDESMPAYFEYELSPLNYELPLLISNEDGNLTRWMPFHYESDRKTRHATSVTGGEKKSGATITSWTAEIFIPYPLLRPLNNFRPSAGKHWRANFYRMDYDSGHGAWSWQPTVVNFHEYNRFGTLIFE